MLQSYFPKLNACQSAPEATKLQYDREGSKWPEQEGEKWAEGESGCGKWKCVEGACQLHLLNDISYQRNCWETDLEQIALSLPLLLSCVW